MITSVSVSHKRLDLLRKVGGRAGGKSKEQKEMAHRGP
jgi:hypothetical protein